MAATFTGSRNKRPKPVQTANESSASCGSHAVANWLIERPANEQMASLDVSIGAQRTWKTSIDVDSLHFSDTVCCSVGFKDVQRLRDANGTSGRNTDERRRKTRKSCRHRFFPYFQSSQSKRNISTASCQQGQNVAHRLAVRRKKLNEKMNEITFFETRKIG